MFLDRYVQSRSCAWLKVTQLGVVKSHLCEWLKPGSPPALNLVKKNIFHRSTRQGSFACYNSRGRTSFCCNEFPTTQQFNQALSQVITGPAGGITRCSKPRRSSPVGPGLCRRISRVGSGRVRSFQYSRVGVGSSGHDRTRGK